MRLFSFLFFLTTAFMPLASTLSGSELRFALAPKVGLPKDSPLFVEDTVNFYGNNAALLTSKFLRTRAETQLRKQIPSSLRIEVNHVPNTSIICLTASGADDSVAAPFLSALFDQFLRFKREQKEKYYHDAIVVADTALASAPPEYGPRLQIYREQLVIVSLLDIKPDFERVDY